MNKRAEKLEITADKVISEIAKLAFANTTDILEITDLKNGTKEYFVFIGSKDKLTSEEGLSKYIVNNFFN